MPVIVGLDLSLTGSGIATVSVAGAELDGDGRTGLVGYSGESVGKSGPENRSQPVLVDTRTIVSSGRKGAPLPSRIARIRRLRNAICDHARHADLVVVEAPAFASSTGQVWDRAGLWHHVMAAVDHLGIPYVEVAPTKVKKFATGKGNADKTAVAAAMSRLWPDVNPGNDNEFDSLALATLGAIRVAGRALPITVLERHREVVAGIDWPVPAENNRPSTG